MRCKANKITLKLLTFRLPQQERLHKFNLTQATNPASRATSICIMNMVFRDDIADEEELQEIMRDVRELLSPFGVVSIELTVCAIHYSQYLVCRVNTDLKSGEGAGFSASSCYMPPGAF